MANSTQKDRTSSTTGHSGGMGNNPSSTTGAAGAALEHGKEMAGSAAEASKGVAGNVMEKAGEAASYVGRKAEDATSSVGSGMRSLADTIRDKGPHEGFLGGATSAVADTLASGGRYLERHGLSGIGEDMTSLIRRNPIPAILIGFGLGFMMARATRS